MDIVNILPILKNKPMEYIKAIQKNYDDFITYSDIPIGYQNLDRITIPAKFRNILDKMYIAVEDRYNLLLNFVSYKNTGYIAYAMIQEYFKQVYSKNENIEKIIYIDTNLLVEDYKRIMNINHLNQSPVHNIDTILRNIEYAPLVIWDKFSKLESTFDKQKIYDLLSIRKRNNCCNIFMIAGGTTNLSQVIGADIFDMMDVDFGGDYSRMNFEVPKKGMNL